MLQVEFIRLALSEVYPDVLIGGNESALRTLLFWKLTLVAH